MLQGIFIPIVGEGNKQPNDTYTEQLVASAKAAIDEEATKAKSRPVIQSGFLL